MALEVLFPIVSGRIVSGLASGLAARAESFTDNVLVRGKLPATRQLRMVTVRDDGGPQEGTIQKHGFGFNVWAESAVVAENLARMCMGILPTLSDGSPIVHVTSLSGPFEVVDESTDLLTVDSMTLSHYFFTAQVWSRGSDL